MMTCLAATDNIRYIASNSGLEIDAESY